MRLVLPLALFVTWFGPAAVAADYRPPDWARKPTAAEMLRVWPRAAILNGEDGKATIRCTVTVQGVLRDCKAISENPPGSGFGSAAVVLASDFTFKPATLDGKPVEAPVNIPITFRGQGVAFKGAAGWPPEESVIASVPWIEAPTYQDVVGAYPPKARAVKQAGRAVLYCRFQRDGGVSRCQTIVDQPSGFAFGEAARSLTRKFRAPMKDSKGVSSYGLFIQIPFTFSTDMLTDAAPIIGKPIWARLPDFDDVVASFPPQARAAGVAVGHVTLNCEVKAAGRLSDCEVIAQSPPGMGFDKAALALSSSFQVTVWSADGMPVVGGRLNVPIRYEGPKPGPAKAKAVPASPGSGG